MTGSINPVIVIAIVMLMAVALISLIAFTTKTLRGQAAHAWAVMLVIFLATAALFSRFLYSLP